mmetsp:Transcript_43698/g.103154  ORF Transcript_43698/g.103154 Transcript_43698/m.103154 type:complete len:210 (-) Transcript_43698:8-637(-)
MGSDEHGLASLQLWCDDFFPVWHHPGNGVLQALGVWKLFWLQSSILCLIVWVELAGDLQRWWGDVEASAPDLHLLGAMLLDGLLLVQACEAAIHALVQAPSLGDRSVQLISALQRNVAGLDGALEEGSVARIQLEATLLNQSAGFLGLAKTLLRQVDIHPASETVGNIPLRLAVAREDQRGVCHCERKPSISLQVGVEEAASRAPAERA